MEFLRRSVDQWQLRLNNDPRQIRRIERRFADAQTVQIGDVSGIIMDPKGLILNQAFIKVPNHEFTPNGHNHFGGTDRLKFDSYAYLSYEAAALFTNPVTRLFPIILASYDKANNLLTFNTGKPYGCPDISDLRAFGNCRLLIERESHRGHWQADKWIVEIGAVVDTKNPQNLNVNNPQ